MSQYFSKSSSFSKVCDTPAVIEKVLCIVVPIVVPYLLPQPAITCLKLTIETLEQGVKYVQS